MALAERHAFLHELLVLNDETRTYLEALPALRVDSGSRKEQADVVAREFEAAVECGDEGIMVKRASAPYAVDGKRGLDWLKIKPDYAEQGCEMIDCAIVGAFEGTGARLHRFRYSHFLLAVPGLERWKPEDGRNDDQGRPLPMTMVTFSKVGTGMSHEDLTVINKVCMGGRTGEGGGGGGGAGGGGGWGVGARHPREALSLGWPLSLLHPRTQRSTRRPEHRDHFCNCGAHSPRQAAQLLWDLGTHSEFVEGGAGEEGLPPPPPLTPYPAFLHTPPPTGRRGA